MKLSRPNGEERGQSLGWYRPLHLSTTAKPLAACCSPKLVVLAGCALHRQLLDVRFDAAHADGQQKNLDASMVGRVLYYFVCWRMPLCAPAWAGKMYEPAAIGSGGGGGCSATIGSLLRQGRCLLRYGQRLLCPDRWLLHQGRRLLLHSRGCRAMADATAGVASTARCTWNRQRDLRC